MFISNWVTIILSVSLKSASAKYPAFMDGFVEVFRQVDSSDYLSLARIPTGPRARDSFFIPKLDLYFVAIPQHQGRDAEIQVYRAQQ